MEQIFLFLNFLILLKNDDTLANHYKIVSGRMDYTVLPPGELMNAIAHQLIGMNQLDRAFKYYQLNIDNYPTSYMSYDATGEYYEFKGDKAKSNEYHQKALTLKDNLEGRRNVGNDK